MCYIIVTMYIIYRKEESCRSSIRTNDSCERLTFTLSCKESRPSSKCQPAVSMSSTVCKLSGAGGTDKLFVWSQCSDVVVSVDVEEGRVRSSLTRLPDTLVISESRSLSASTRCEAMGSDPIRPFSDYISLPNEETQSTTCFMKRKRNLQKNIF